MHVKHYLIGFENKRSANAPAQEVVITETLDATSTSRRSVSGTSGSATLCCMYRKKSPDRPTGTRIDASTSLGFYIDVSAALNPQTRLVTWTFKSIDPDTLEPPLDIDVGFLPPNVTPPQGYGWVTYSLSRFFNRAVRSSIQLTRVAQIPSSVGLFAIGLAGALGSARRRGAMRGGPRR